VEFSEPRVPPPKLIVSLLPLKRRERPTHRDENNGRRARLWPWRKPAHSQGRTQSETAWRKLSATYGRICNICLEHDGYDALKCWRKDVRDLFHHASCLSSQLALLTSLRRRLASVWNIRIQSNGRRCGLQRDEKESIFRAGTCCLVLVGQSHRRACDSRPLPAADYFDNPLVRSRDHSLDRRTFKN
jgi:hypothetical protein